METGLSGKTVNNDGFVTKMVNNLAGIIQKIVEKTEKKQGKAPEVIAVSLYFVGHILMTIVHEPWFDEALAWLIARDSSLYDILFTAPQYEGHPSLWHLVLMPFAKAGAPYELSLSIVSLVFSGAAILLFVFKSPFKRIIRLLMPFTFFLFYQYSVVSRPYCMMMLAFVLVAITYKERDEKPGRFVLSLWFLCLTGAYGIVIAGGICVAWIIRMFVIYACSFENKTFRVLCKDYLFKRGKFVWLLGLLIYVLFILWRIMPADNAYAAIRATEAISDNGIVVRLLYTFFASLSDLFVTNVFYTSGTLMNADMYIGELIAAVFIGVGILIFLIRSAIDKNKKKFMNICKILEFVVPYSFYALFSAIVYLYYHHIGIGLLFMIYWLWIGREQDSGVKSDMINAEHSDTPKGKLINSAIIVVYAIAIIIPIYWNISSCIMDCFQSYGCGRNEYEYLSEHGLDEDYTIFTDWRRIFKPEEVPEAYTEFYPLLSQPGVNIAPYLKKDVIINDPGFIGKNYSYEHAIEDKNGTLEIVGKMSAFGSPDIIIGEPDFNELFEVPYVDYNDYVLVFKDIFGNIKKGYISDRITYIFVRKDIAEEKGLKTIRRE